MNGTRQYDAIVIGSGQGGNPLAVAFAQAGRKTALIEREHVGGTCINEGCAPTKTMVASAREAYLARRADLYGVHVGPVSVDLSEVVARKRAIVESFRTGSERRLADNGVDLLRGVGSFVAPHTVRVRLAGGEAAELTAPTIVIDTGGRPADPPLEGLKDVPHLNSTSIMELEALPDHLLVLGGGYVGLEFGQMFRRFGSRVTIVQRGPQLLGREDADVAREVAAILREEGIEVLLDTEAVRVCQAPDGGIELTVRSPEGERILRGSHLLAAAGRSPNTEALDLEAAGIERDARGFVKVDDRLQTSVPGVYALGDVAGSPAFTHISYDDFRILRANLLEGGRRSRTGRLVPYTVFIDPQLGRVGLSEGEARAQGRAIQVAKIPMSYVARALEVDESRGFVKAVVDEETGRILGCAVLGIEGGEIMAMLEIAILGGLPYTVLRDAIFAHPTLAELLNTLFSSLEPADATSGTRKAAAAS
ncbi:MAG: mercuric reductase [Chloroflexi bacterium]|nr:mercuric reductase [Chloroflexota bacterium]